MTEARIHRRIIRNRKKNRTPLSKLRTSDAVKTVVNHPRRLEELLKMLEDKDRIVRGRAAVALTRLSESHPARLLRVSLWLKEALGDDSAYVRWHLLYTLGMMGAKFPSLSRNFMEDIVCHLEDDNRICRMMAVKAIGQVGSRKPQIIEECFKTLKKEIPAAIARNMRRSRLP